MFVASKEFVRVLYLFLLREDWLEKWRKVWVVWVYGYKARG